MRVIELRVRSFMRIETLDLRPGIGITPIKGENESGKTSTLDALWVVLRGRAVAPPQPIKKGHDQCVIQVTLGNEKPELIITRKFTKQDGVEYTQTLDIRTPEGAKITNKPQAVLDALAGELGFDPLHFERADPKTQFEMMRALVPGIDFDKIAKARQEAFDERTIANRQLAAARIRADAIVLPGGPEPQPVDVSAALELLATASTHNAAVRAAATEDERLSAEIDRREDEAERLRARAATLEREAATFTEQRTTVRATAAKPLMDETALRTAIGEAQRTSHVIAAFAARRQQLADVEQLAQVAADLTRKIDALDQEKAEAIAGADLPVEGLSLGDGVVTYQDLPFSQAAAAVKMRISVAVAMALNPNLKVVLVRDGSLLDKRSLRALAEMAQEHGFDVLLETVDTSMPGGIEIVDGVGGDAKKK